ncbi:MAG TPA: hypothetical protein VFX60_07135 [Micromonospora sp.]|nr:hypothetical protein [Micromonospora sp.]
MTVQSGSGLSAAPPPGARGRWWSERVGYLAAAGAVLYGMLALGWALTGEGYPFGPNDPGGEISLLRLLPAEVGAPVVAAVALITAVVAFSMTGKHAVRLRGVPRFLLLVYGWSVAAVLLVVVPDMEVLALAGYAPMLILSLPFGGLGVDYAEVFDWALANKCVAVVGGLLLARAVLTWQSRTAGGCVSCGRRVAGGDWTSPESAARWGRWAAWTAAVIPAVYAATRFAWLAGIPLGISDGMLQEMQENGQVWAGAGLAACGVVGGVLTLGLTQRWGEVFPRWMVGLAGRRVPVMLAVVPAALVAAAVAAASVGFLGSPQFWEFLGEFSGGYAPLLLWPLWAVMLAAATLAYYLRRRSTCPRCSLPSR